VGRAWSTGCRDVRILIANRGEIATRIIRTAHRLGLETIAAYADPDRVAPHVRMATVATRLGPADLRASYLSTDALLQAAARTGATAVHPGYGFLAERADVAYAVAAAGMTWIGPRPQAVEAMGSKIEGRRLASEAGVAIIPGFDASQDDDALAGAAGTIGYPVLIKAAGGGGGKGIRIATAPSGFAAALREARAEASRSFGDDAVIVERYITRPRHIEVQVVGDHYGNVVDLGTRECSVQRRYQKLLEEAPAPNLTAETEADLRASAVALAKAIGYDSVGTVEFVLDDETGTPYFLEMNTRLQVEHTVTEEVSGLDLVECQIRVATGEHAPFPLEGPEVHGHSFEARINAEEPSDDFAPQTGVVSALQVPPGVRWDSGIEVGSEITPFYDSMVGKLVVHGPDRETARRRLLLALDGLLIGGVRTNGWLHRWLLEQEPVVAGRVTTRFLDDARVPSAPGDRRLEALAAVAWLAARDGAAARGDAWRRIGRRRLTPHSSPRQVFLEGLDGTVVNVAVVGTVDTFRVIDGPELSEVRLEAGALLGMEEAVANRNPAHVDVDRRVVAIADRARTATFAVRSRVQEWSRGPEDVTGARSTSVCAPIPAVVAEVLVGPGDVVVAGQVLVVIEAMKMLQSLCAQSGGVVADVRVRAGDQVGSGDVLITFEERPATK
jgi:acetyl/propionyl-CoA carboxylase alpha subunit